MGNNSRRGLGFDESLQLYSAVHHFHDVFHIVALLLLLQIFRFLTHKFVEARLGQLSRLFSGGLFCLQKGFVELIHFLGFFFWLGANHAKRFCNLGIIRR